MLVGLDIEVIIVTNKLHIRIPMDLRDTTMSRVLEMGIESGITVFIYSRIIIILYHPL